MISGHRDALEIFFLLFNNFAHTNRQSRSLEHCPYFYITNTIFCSRAELLIKKKKSRKIRNQFAIS